MIQQKTEDIIQSHLKKLTSKKVEKGLSFDSLFLYLLLILSLGCSKANVDKNDTTNLLDAVKNDTLSIRKKIAIVDSVYAKVNNSLNDSVKFVKLVHIANEYYDLRASLKYKQICKQLIFVSQKSLDIDNQGLAYYYYGDYFQFKTINDSAYYYYLQAEKLFVANSNFPKLIDTYLAQSYLLYSQDDFFECEYKVLRVLKLLEEYPNCRKKNVAFSLLALTSYELRDYERAIEYNKEAIKIVENCENNPNNIAIFLNNIGGCYQEQKQHKVAIKYFNDAVKVLGNHNNNLSTFYTLYDNLAYSNLKLNGCSDEARFYFEKCRTIALDSANKFKMITSKVRYAEFLQIKKDSLKANEIALEALQIASHHNRAEMLPPLKFLIGNNPTNNSEYATKYILIKDSIIEIERQNRNKFARIRFETDSLTTEKKDAIKQKWIISVVMSVLLVIVCFIFVILRERSKHNQLKAVANQNTANQELYTLMLQHQDSVQEGRTRERRRIARDLHDGVMNGLASTRIQLFEMARRVQDSKVLAKYAEGIQNIETEIRNISHDLTAETFKNDEEFKILLKELFSGQMRDGGFKFHVQYNSDINWEFLSSTHKVNLYRIFQEIMQNAVKHSHASLVTVTPKLNAKKLIIEVVDNGLGFESLEIVGFGLQNIRDRLASMRGKLEISNLRTGGAKYKMLITL